MATASLQRIPRVFDKYALPKLAFFMVTGSSLAGATLTGMRHGWDDWPMLLARWATYWVLALLLGSELWKVLYLRPSVALRPVPEAVAYGNAMLQLHRGWQKALAPLLLLLAAVHLNSYAAAQPWVALTGLSLAVALGAMLVTWLRPGDAQRQDSASVVSLVGLALTAASLAGLDVSLQAAPAELGAWVLIPNRILHVWAFSAWLGGALWNIAIAVPAGRVRENMDSVILANFQLERFRVVVRAVFPTIVLTGLVQTWAMFGWNVSGLLTTTWGWLILAKLGLIALLVGVFITCPMWGACSPIRGVCNLDDLYSKEDEA